MISSLVFWNEFVESLIPASSPNENILSLQITRVNLWSYQVLFIMDVNHRNSDMLIIYNITDAFIQVITFSRSEVDGYFLKQNITLAFDILLWHLILVELINVMQVLLFRFSKRGWLVLDRFFWRMLPNISKVLFIG